MYQDSWNRIIVWKRPDDTYYFKIVKGHYSNYQVNYVNSYKHKIVLIIDDLQYRVRPISKKNKIKKELINLINKL